MVRQALPLSPYDERLYRALLRATVGPGQPGRAPLGHGPAADTGRARRAAGRLQTRGGGAKHPGRTASIPRRPPSIVTCSRGRLQPEGTPPGCRVASRHGEKLFWEIGRTRRRNGRWRHLSRADAGELVRRAGRDRPGRAGFGRPRQVPLQQDPGGGRADHRTRRGTPRLAFDICGTTEPRPAGVAGPPRRLASRRRATASSSLRPRPPARRGTTRPWASSPRSTPDSR